MFSVISDFFPNFDEVRAQLDELDYSAAVNPYDNVEYQGICTEIPQSIKNHVYSAINHFFGRFPDNTNLFLRLSTEGVTVPHQAHNDESMGNWAMMIYVNRPEHCAGGTEFIDHVDHPMANGPTDDAGVEVWKRDNNDKNKWMVIDTVKMGSNKALVFPAKRMHRAVDPVSFGTTPKDGRLLLICFFTL